MSTTKKRPAAKRTSKRKSNPALRIKRRSAVRTRSRRRRNPIGMNASSPMKLLTPALVGALGATAVNTVLANVGSALPASMMAGNMQFLTRAALSLGLGYLGGKSSKRNMFMQMAEGSLTVTIHDAITSLSTGMGMQLQGMGLYMPGRVPNAVPQGGARSVPQLSGMGAYMTGSGSPQQRALVAARQAATAAKPRRLSGFGF